MDWGEWVGKWERKESSSSDCRVFKLKNSKRNSVPPPSITAGGRCVPKLLAVTCEQVRTAPSLSTHLGRTWTALRQRSVLGPSPPPRAPFP